MRSLTAKLAAIALVVSCSIPLARAESPPLCSHPGCEAQQEADLWRQAHKTRSAYASWARSTSGKIRALNRRADPVDRFVDDFLASDSADGSGPHAPLIFSIFSPLPLPSGTYIVHALSVRPDPALATRLISAAKKRFPTARVVRSEDPFGIKKSQASRLPDSKAMMEIDISIVFKHPPPSDFEGSRAAIAKLRAQEEPKGLALYAEALAAGDALTKKLLDADPPFFPSAIFPSELDEPFILFLKAYSLR